MTTVVDTPFAPDTTRRIRVLHIVPLPPPQGGMATFAVGMLGSVLGDAFDLIPLRADRVNKLKHRGIVRKVLNLVNLMLLSWAMLWRIVWYRPKIVHIQSNSGGGFLANAHLAFQARLLGRKVLMSIHGGGFRDFYDRAGRLNRHHIRTGLRVPHRIICATPRMWDTLSQIGVPEERLALIGNGINPAERTRTEVTPDGEPLRVLFLNRVTVPKGVCELIDAAVRLHEAFPQMRVRIAGFPSDDQPALEAHMNECGAGEYVHFVGGIETDAKEQEYLDADIYALPSHVEDLPYGMLEAMGYGLPCVVSDVGGLSTLTEQGASGLLVPPQDVDALVEALGRLLGDATLRQQLGRAARERIVTEYSWDHRGGQIVELYRDVLDQSPVS